MVEEKRITHEYALEKAKELVGKNDARRKSRTINL